MVPEPRVLESGATAQEAGQLLARNEVRAVLVCEDGRLLGIVPAGTLVERVVAAGRDARRPALREIVEAPLLTLDPEMGGEEAFRLLEERDAERVPVAEDGRLVGVLSRSVLMRRLAEDGSPTNP